MAASSLTPGRGLFLVGNLLYSVGAFLADYNVTHVFNKNWPPHAKFHNGQTMSLGILLALTSTYFAFRPAFSQLSPAEAKHNILTAAVVGSFYCVAGLSAIFYPGTHWFDPEFEMKVPKWSSFGWRITLRSVGLARQSLSERACLVLQEWILRLFPSRRYCERKLRCRRHRLDLT
jgi:hypothetical protein